MTFVAVIRGYWWSKLEKNYLQLIYFIDYYIKLTIHSFDTKLDHSTLILIYAYITEDHQIFLNDNNVICLYDKSYKLHIKILKDIIPKNVNIFFSFLHLQLCLQNTIDDIKLLKIFNMKIKWIYAVKWTSAELLKHLLQSSLVRL